MLTFIAKLFRPKFAKHRKRFMHIEGDVLIRNGF